MSTTTRRLGLEIFASTRGVDAAFSRLNAGLTRIGTGVRGNARDMGLWQQQMKAVGTTARYFLAGQLIFGVTAAIGKLGEFEKQLGQVNALAGRIGSDGKLVGLGSQLDDIGTSAIILSNKFGIAVPEVETYMQRFYTAFKPQGRSPKEQTKQMMDFVNAHLELVTMLGSRAGDPNALAGGLASLVRIMPGGEAKPGDAAKTLSNYFAKIVTSSPNLSGQDIANAAGRLASAHNISGMSARDILAVFGTAAQAGGSPAIITRGITQLIGQSLMHPTRPQSKTLYQQAGLPSDPNALYQMGATKVLERLMDYVQQGRAGLAPGQRNPNVTAIYNAFSRGESVRQFVNLLANDGTKGLERFIKQLDKSAKDNEAQQRANAVISRSGVLLVQHQMSNLSLDLVRSLNWPISHGIEPVTHAVSNAAARHRTTTSILEGALVGGLALRGLNKLRRRRGLGPGGAAAAALETEAMGNVLAGGVPTGSRDNPFWVIIHPTSNLVGTQLGGGTPTGPTGPKSSWFKKLVPVAKVGKFSLPGLSFLAGDAGLAATGIGLPLAALLASEQLGNRYDPNKGGVSPHKIEAAFEANRKRMFPGATFPPGGGGVTISPDGRMDLTVRLVDAQGRPISTQRHPGVPVKLWGSTGRLPTAQGQAGARKAAR